MLMRWSVSQLLSMRARLSVRAAGEGGCEWAV